MSAPLLSCHLSQLVTAAVLLIIFTYRLPSGGAKFILEEEKKPAYLSAHVGESIVFNCELDFPQGVMTPYFLYYYKDGERILTLGEDSETVKEYAGRARLEVEGEVAKMTLQRLRESDRGWYECRIYFPNRTPPTRLNGTWYHLTVHGRELLSLPPLNETVLEGEETRLECGSREPEVRVTWYKDGLPLEPAAGGRLQVTPGGSLVFSSAGVTDPGLYTCEVISPEGLTQSASAYLDVKYKARVVYTEKEVYLPFGRPGLLDCHVAANPALVKLRWEKDGFLFDPPNVPGVFNKRNGSLYFNKVEESHGGEYTCTPFNDLGTLGPSPGIRVVVQHPPVFTLTPHNLYLRRTGDSVLIPCDARDSGDSAHRPNILWIKKDGSPLPDRASVTGGNLTIHNIDESDRGGYQCVATNEAATISTETELLIEGSAPRGPTNLTAGSVSYTSVSLSWRPASPALSDHYSVWYRGTDSPEWRTVEVSGDRATISALDPGREYEFMVLVQDPLGDGMSSKPIRIKTKGRPIEPSAGAPTAGESVLKEERPGRVRVTPTGEGYLLDWEPPASGQVEYYRLFWAEGALAGSSPVVIDTTDSSFLVGDLEEGGIYHFQVKAVTVNNSESSSDTFILHVPGRRTAAGSLAYLCAALLGFILGTSLLFMYSHRDYFKKVARVP